MVITVEIVWLVVLGVAIVAALLDAFIIACAGEDRMLIFPIVFGQWVALGVVGGILTAILTA